MAEPRLSIRGVTKSFGALVVSDAVDLDLRAGEIHALIGPNGAGKSTLIGQISGAIRPDGGRIALDGRDATEWDVPARARAGLGRTFQVSSLALEDSALQNVMLALAGRERRIGIWRRALLRDDLVVPARDALAEVGLSGREDVPAGALSHGDRRRVEIAAALALDPRALVMDEPLAGLGTEGVADLSALLRRVKARAPILLVEHDMDAVFALADRVSVLVGGRIIATGTGPEIRADPSVQDAYLGSPA
ncbi:ABC transporter ATP-binding protein [Palleronia sp. LCG004]|uniref:ABC transporter ATP-binding protein n=1 Tax=Palleronia sp. LCG004 TaxID=3079304 RepID=UPI0029437EC8|nr:ABC transporter ATP-binding protein [Palleronia sp. LCG004]WOI56392.1 ABC transporter ATP-binding protein [Palleronia sp. LCG004]